MNLSSWLILIILVISVLYIVRNMKKQRKNGANVCTGDCSHCHVRHSTHHEIS